MQAFFSATSVVALAEIGDKTQLLALMLAARFRKPVPIILGILLATLLNHGLAGALGRWLGEWLNPDYLRWILGLSFIAMGVWMLIPDQLDDEEASSRRFGVFATTLMVFFMAEMGDKTQIATVALAARFSDYWQVVLGTTLGMLLANVPAVLFGHHFAQRLPVRAIHAVAALLFAVLGVMTLTKADMLF